MFRKKYKHHEIKHKTLYFETDNGEEILPCSNCFNSPYSVEDINKGAIAWLHTDKYNIPAGITYEDFISTLEKYGDKVYLLKE